MGGKAQEAGGNVAKLENQISIIKYTLLATNALVWMIGAAVFALCLWLRFEPGLQEWIEKLELSTFYIGVYILLAAAILMMVFSFIGCIAALQENKLSILVYVGTQALSFVFGLVGTAILLDNSSRDSRIQPMIRESVRRLIMNSHHEASKATLAMVQEEIGCCGADGPNDYLSLRQPLPTQCRDTVTGNPFFHGCVDELTWFFEEKATWIGFLVMTVCFVHICNVVMSVVLNQALKKEEDEAYNTH